MINDSDCGISLLSQPCYSVRGVTAGIIASQLFIQPLCSWEYCHTATICLDLISLSRDGAGGKERDRKRKENSRKGKQQDRERERGKMGWKIRVQEKAVWKCGTCVLPRRLINILQTALHNTSRVCGTLSTWLPRYVNCVFMPTPACVVFIYRLCLWWIAK